MSAFELTDVWMLVWLYIQHYGVRYIPSHTHTYLPNRQGAEDRGKRHACSGIDILDEKDEVSLTHAWQHRVMAGLPFFSALLSRLKHTHTLFFSLSLFLFLPREKTFFSCLITMHTASAQRNFFHHSPSGRLRGRTRLCKH